MLVIRAENVNDAYDQAMYRIGMEGVQMDSRNGPVRKFPYPVVTEYKLPIERVLFDSDRDANPFFHLFESIWMLAGRNDIEFLKKFNSTIGQFSDDGETLHGAYGHRWRNHFNYDQLDLVIKSLVMDRNTRRAVLAMWDPYIDPDVAALGGKDVPCNTHVYFNVRPDGYLDMTVCNRSNDMVWGCYGANAVHMSILHEYIALATGLPMGFYYQISNDLHVYEKHWGLIKGAKSDEVSPYDVLDAHVPLLAGIETPAMFDYDVTTFLMDPYTTDTYRTHWFRGTIRPMALAHAAFKSNRPEAALVLAAQIEAEDWRSGCQNWLDRRIKPKNVFDPKGPQEIVPRRSL